MKTEKVVALLLVVIIGYLFYLIMMPFWIPIFWGIVIVILFYPVYQWLLRKIRCDWLASILTCIIITLFITIPLIFISIALVNEMIGLYPWAETYLRKSAQQMHNPSSVFYHIKEVINRYVEISIPDIQNIILKNIKEGSSFLVQNLKGIITNFTWFIINIILSLFAMFYLFKDGDQLVESVKALLPLSEREKKVLFKKNRAVIYATLYGGLVAAVAQGFLGGITFWLLGLSSPVFWGTLMAILSFVPILGPPIIWAPASIYLLVNQNYGKGIILIIVGMLVIGLADNLLRPIIVSGKTKIHPMLLFFSILGALKLLGFIGIVAGPIILSLTLVTLNFYKAGYLRKTKS